MLKEIRIPTIVNVPLHLAGVNLFNILGFNNLTDLTRLTRFSY